MPVNSLVVDSTFEQSENVAIVRFLVVSSSWPAMRGAAYAIIGSKFGPLSSAHAHCTIGLAAREMILFRFSLSM